MANHKKPIDEKLLEGLASIHCTDEEMAKMVGVSAKTLRKRYGHLIDEARVNGKVSLRRKAFKKALDGNGDSSCLIYLHKTYLGAPETINVNHTGSIEVKETNKKKSVLDNATEEQLRELKALLEKVKSGQAKDETSGGDA